MANSVPTSISGGSYLWYDLETTGTDPRWDRTVQFACVRTDLALNELGEPTTTFIKCPADVLPNPQAVAVTGLTPQHVNRLGIGELEAHVMINRLFAQPETCVTGFNNLRFDDEFMRFGFYRHFIEPYAREWQSGNTRWDIIDLARAAAALRPEGLEWPREEGLLSFRLEALAAANRIEHGAAHDALSDVRATLGLARLLKERQPRLFDFYLGSRDRARLQLLLRPEQPAICIHVSRMFSRERQCIAPVMPLARHPNNRNSIIVADLGRDANGWIDWDVDRLRDALFGDAPQTRPGLKEIRLNRCPFVAPLASLRSQDASRLGINIEHAQRQFDIFKRAGELRLRLAAVYSRSPREPQLDADAALYDGFLSSADRAQCARALGQLLSGAQSPDVMFGDARLNELLFRFRARRNDSALTADELLRWRQIVRRKLVGTSTGGLTLASYRSLLDQLEGSEDVKEALRQHGDAIEDRYCR